MQRVIQTNETYGNTTYSTSYTYNQLGRLSAETYPSGFQVKNKYNNGGYLIAVKDSDDNTLWQADEHDIYGHLTQFHTGNGLTTYRDYDSENGRLLGIITSDGRNLLQNYVYTYDDFGNFASRKKFGSPMLQENFTYDNFNRLTGIQTNGVSYSMSYDRYGRMESKSQHDFSFDNARFSADHPHAVSRVQAHRQPPFAGHTVTYTPFNKVQTVTMGNDNLLIEYGYDRQRIRMTETVNGNQRVKTYVGNCEFIQPSTGDNYSLTYLSSPDGIFAVAESTSNGYRLHYVHTDNLGSWDIITDMGGSLEQSLSFDAWGNRRNVSTWNGPAHDVPLFDRGFTGHEHLYNFGLINMNGRVYDPLMSSFLSPDNFIQCPDNSQNFNRYAYCLNNPLRYTDPSGEFCWHIVIGALIGGTANLVANWDNCSGFWEYAAAFGAGAGTGAAVAATGGMGFVAGAGIAAAGGAATSATNSVIAQTGKNFAGIGNVDWGQVGLNAGVGALSGFAGYGVGQWAATNMGGVLINGFNITSPVAKGVIGGAIGGAAGGYAGGFVGGYIMTGDLEEAHNAGLNGMWQGAVIGGISGGIGGYVAAKGEGINPWTGIHNKSVVLGESMANRVIPAAKDMQAEYLDAPQMEDAYFGHEISPNTTYTNKTSMEYNAQWIEGKMGQDYHLYDIGPAGSKVTSPYYNMEQCRTISYQYLHNCHYNSIKIYNFQIRLITWK